MLRFTTFGILGEYGESHASYEVIIFWTTRCPFITVWNVLAGIQNIASRESRLSKPFMEDPAGYDPASTTFSTA